MIPPRYPTCDTKSPLQLCCGSWTNRQHLPFCRQYPTGTCATGKRGTKLPGQCSLFRKEGSRSASGRYDCQHQGGREPGSGGGQVNIGEAVLNVVSNNKPKMLTGLDQKVRGQVQGLQRPLAQMQHHRRIAAAFPPCCNSETW